MKYLLLSTAMFTSAFAFPATAEDAAAPAAEFSTEYKILAKDEEGRMADNVKYTNTACGSNIAISADFASFQKSDYKGNSINGWCNAPADALKTLCESNEMYKTAVSGKIKEIKCSYGAERAISLDGTTVNYTVDFKSSNDGEFAREYLNSKL